ncbi:TIGR00156 family protein [Actinobacillus porcitonsillarum]|uniref:TIGR00156 family protein n=1 Tax=Actinobacillus porcitonsillarum TaxID=189834 RepID=A0A2U8FIB6_9PAST|nr:NirD/YgiW/YdeI family stress tolerance protein [Actinobacillus porcitonsillarum]AWI50695.1 TIGR00156 family protein [Actinobacillus porcitonsillarum]
MKKLLVLTSLFAFSAATMANGFNDGKNHSPSQGFFDENIAVKTVNDALKASDKTPAMIEGNIVKQLDDDEFLFKDSTGEIKIEVSKKAWNGQDIKPEDTIQIRGKVDNEWNKTEIDVKQIIKK